MKKLKKKHTCDHPLKKKGSIHLCTCLYVLKHPSIGLRDLWRDQLDCEPNALLVVSQDYHHFHGSRVSWHYEANYLLMDTKWYRENVIYPLQVTHTQRIKHSPRSANCFFLSLCNAILTPCSLPWSIRGPAFIVRFYILLSFPWGARKRTQWQNEVGCFYWKSKATTQWSNTRSVIPLICVPKTQIISVLKKKVHFQRWSRSARCKHVQMADVQSRGTAWK